MPGGTAERRAWRMLLLQGRSAWAGLAASAAHSRGPAAASAARAYAAAAAAPTAAPPDPPADRSRPPPAWQRGGSGDAGDGPNSRSRQLDALKRYGRDFTEEARRGLLDPVIGRERVIRRVVQVLLRRTKNNPILIGDAGVGKTAVVEGIAQLISGGDRAPPGLASKRLVALDVAAVVAGSSYRGEFEERLKALLAEVELHKRDTLLFIDEIHVLVGAGNSEGGLDFANMLKPALARGQLQCIGATTLDEYRQHIEPDPALSRRFQPVLVEEPSEAECLALLRGLAPRYEAHHRVHYAPSALAAAVSSAKRYLTERRLPDSAIDLIDEAAARVALGWGGGDASEDVAPAYAARALAAAAGPAAGMGVSYWDGSSGGGGDGVSGSSGGASAGAASVKQGGLSGFESDAAAAGFRVESAGSSLQPTKPQRQQPVDSNQQRPLEQQSAPPQAAPSSSGGDAPRAAAAGRLATWQDWVAAQGWSGSKEARRQQLLEWFGASPAVPLPGDLGHTQTTLERRRKHAELFGPQAASEAAAGTPSNAPSSSSPLPPGPTYEELMAALPPAVRQALEQAEALGAAAPAAARGELVPKSCPHCGDLTPAAPGAAVLRCGGCGARWLNVPPDKLQLGTTVLLERQQQRPLGAFGSGGGGGGGAAVVGPGGGANETAAVTWGIGKRTAVAVRDGPGEAEGQQQQQQQQRWEAGSGRETDSGDAAVAAADLSSGGGNGSSSGSSSTPVFGWGEQQAADGGGGASSASMQLPMWPVVTEGDIYKVITEATGIPTDQLGPGAAGRLAGLAAELSSRVFGQAAAVAAAASALRVARLGLTPGDAPGAAGRPAASLLLLGPDGVGKSTLARAVGDALLPGEPAARITLAMGDYGERHSVARLVGAPPGYVGYNKGGLLTEALKRRPHSVVSTPEHLPCN